MIVSLASALTWGGLTLEAVAIPPKPREEMAVQLPELPESTRTEQDESAEKHLTTAPEQATTPYTPQAVQEWSPGVGTADLTDVEPGQTVPVENVPTVSLGIPEEGDPAALAGEWTVDLKAPADSQAAEVDGLLMEITPPATADPEAEVTVGVDYTPFADLYGPQAADRFGVVLLPDCVVDAPTEGECAPEQSADEPANGATASAQPLASRIEVIQPKATAGLRAAAAKEGETLRTRRVVTATVPVSELLGAGTGAKTSGAMRAAASAETGSRAVGVLDTGASAAGDFTATPSSRPAPGRPARPPVPSPTATRCRSPRRPAA